MPIRDDIRHHYGREWKKVTRPRILARAKVEHYFPDREETRQVPRCECTGQCGFKHETTDGRCCELDHEPNVTFNEHGTRKRGRRLTHERATVYLTVAHLDQDSANMEDSNLLAVCQQCHNRMDAPFRPVHQIITKIKRARRARLAGGQQEFGFVRD